MLPSDDLDRLSPAELKGLAVQQLGANRPSCSLVARLRATRLRGSRAGPGRPNIFYRTGTFGDSSEVAEAATMLNFLTFGDSSEEPLASKPPCRLSAVSSKRIPYVTGS
jgi:hypothetical protein